ncbi:GyrI-like domain-containing protein [Rhodoblastus sp.]|uniref:GyrI-like domain-containing protein n=1 Tax=Rhodoblastus sp. TaxID=1962975 RepID=UPI003F9460E2
MQNGKFFTGHTARLVLLLATIAAPLPSLAQPAPAEAPKAEAPKEAPPAAPDTSAAPAEDSSIQTVEVAAGVVIQTNGAASWEEGYGKIGEALAKLRASAEKAGLKVTGRPLAVFTDTDDAGFKFNAMLPVEAAADAKPNLGPDVSLAQSPSGKAIRFQHRGAYDDIDTTYDAITAYLDEKGLEARNLFVEEYLTDAKDSSDMALQVDIFVFLK